LFVPMKATVKRLLIIGSLVAATLAAPAAASAARLAGQTSQCPPAPAVCGKVELVHDASMTLLRSFRIEWEASCAQTAAVMRDATTVTGLGIARGRFFDSDAYEQPTGTDGYTALVEGKLNGRVKRTGTASGTFKATVTVVNAAKQQVDVCTTPEIVWKARRR
jgi:hypothetical protein